MMAKWTMSESKLPFSRDMDWDADIRELYRDGVLVMSAPVQVCMAHMRFVGADDDCYTDGFIRIDNLGRHRQWIADDDWRWFEAGKRTLDKVSASSVRIWRTEGKWPPSQPH